VRRRSSDGGVGMRGGSGMGYCDSGTWNAGGTSNVYAAFTSTLEDVSIVVVWDSEGRLP
jgi:hypothetical protein